MIEKEGAQESRSEERSVEDHDEEEERNGDGGDRETNKIVEEREGLVEDDGEE